MRNFSDEQVTVARGEKIAQGIFMRADVARWKEQEEHRINEESRGGFGSTG
jgi:dUTP pyrophosphatase